MVSMAAEGMSSFSVVSVVEDVLRQHGTRLSDIDFASRKAEEASSRRYEAAGWLRKIVGVVCSKDLPAEPSEEDFRLGLRSGMILCTAINKVQPGSVPKVVEAPNDSAVIPDGAALMAYQYFENVRNFLVAVEELGLPTFEASDLEQGGKTARVVNCVLALKSFSEWKGAGGSGSWKYSGSVSGSTKTPSVGKPYVRKNSEPFMASISRTSSVSERSVDTYANEQYNDLGVEFSDMSNSLSLNVMIRALLMDKKPEEIPNIVESMLSRVTEEFERRLANQPESVKTTPETMSVSGQNMSPSESPKAETQNDDDTGIDKVCEPEVVSEPEQVSEDEKSQENIPCEAPKSDLNKQITMAEPQKSDMQVSESNSEALKYLKLHKNRLKKQITMVDRQKTDIQELKRTVHTTKEGMQLLQMKYREDFNCLGKHMQTLAHAAAGYQKVLEENRKLYNQVQDLKGNIRVYCRVRPFLPGQASGTTAVDNLEDRTITITTPSKYGKDGKKPFTFNKVFGPSATQAEVFADMQPLIRSVLDGYNVCIFAYGQTGSGKTFTMTGPNNLTEETYGVNYRALNDLFLLTEQRKATFSYEVSVQMMEIYNEQVRDLLATDGSNKRLEIRNSSQNGINVPDANRLPVSSTADVINLMNLGHKNRAVSYTAMNDRSSRSHSCMTVHVQGKDLTSGATLRGCMHLVDLAGSERVDKSEVTGDRLKEAQHINKSLAALGDVIASLASKNTHVPYRNSKLTQLLQDSLGGQAKTLMFVHISPEVDAVGETISTLKFAERVSTVELGAAKANKETSDVKDLKEQIANLKAALSRKDEEMEQLTRSFSTTPETMSIKSTTSTASSPIHPNWRATKETSSGGRKTPTDDGGNTKGKKTPTQKSRRRSLDPSDLLSDATHWPPLTAANKADKEKSLTTGDWMEKVLMKQDPVDRHRSLENFGDENRKSSETLYHQSDDLVTDKNGSADSDVQISRYSPATTEDIDEPDLATSDSSEPDVQVHIPRVSSLPSVMGSKIKKPQAKPSKSPEKKSLIPMAPSRRLSNGATSPITKNGRQGVNGKRKTGTAK